MENKDKITRDAFLYLEPSERSYGDSDKYAHCSTCYSWMGEKRQRCYILGKDLEVKAEATCCLYVNGKPEIERAGSEKKLITAKDAGFQDSPPNCRRCYWYATGFCGLFAKLNLKDPDHFDLKVPVSKNGCCNAWTPQYAEFKNEGLFEFLNKKVNFKKLLGG